MNIHSISRRASAWGLIALCAAASAAAADGAAAPLSLQDAVRRGVERAPLVAARADSVDAMREDAVRAGRLPDPSLSVGLANFPVTQPGALSAASDSMTMRTVGVTQAIPSRAARTAERRVADARIGVASANRAATVQSVRQRVADAWIGVWAAEQRREQLAALRDESAVAVAIAKARLRGGGGSATDALAAQAEALTLENRLDAIDAELRAARAGLGRWLGDPLPPLAAAPDFAHLPQNPARLESAVDRQAPMQVWQAREDAARAALAAARAAKRPDFRVSLSYGNRAPGLSDMVNLEFGVSLPLFTRYRQDAGISAEHDAWRAVQAEHEDARRDQREAVARALAAWRGWQRQIARDRDALLPLARDRTRTALAAFRGGAELQPWIEARRAEIELRMSYVDARAAEAEQWAALAYLLPSTGDLP